MSNDARTVRALQLSLEASEKEVARLTHENELMTQTLGYQERQALEAEVARLTAELARWQGAEQIGTFKDAEGYGTYVVYVLWYDHAPTRDETP